MTIKEEEPLLEKDVHEKIDEDFKKLLKYNKRETMVSAFKFYVLGCIKKCQDVQRKQVKENLSLGKKRSRKKSIKLEDNKDFMKGFGEGIITAKLKQAKQVEELKKIVHSEDWDLLFYDERCEKIDKIFKKEEKCQS